MNIGNITLRVILLVATLMLCGCGKSDTCLEADDFGFAKTAISSRYAETEIFGDRTAEVTPWRDRDLVLNGKPLYIVVKNWVPGQDANEPGVLSAWCPWYGDKDHSSTLTNYCERLTPCNFKGSENCSRDEDGMPTNDSCFNAVMCTNTSEAQIANPPCLMTKGIGLYALLIKQNKQNPFDPNLSINTMSAPLNDPNLGVVMHVGAPHAEYYISSMSDSGKISNSGGVVYDYDKDHSMHSSRVDYVNGKLYFKILDNFYEDNNGQYRVFIKSGIVNGGWDPISWCINLVKTSLFGNSQGGSYERGGTGIVPAIYESIVVNSSFTNTVRAALMLFVIFSAMGFLMGSIELSQKELLERILKVIIIVALISPGSWKFFNEYVFIWFYEGADFVINILYQVAASGPGSSNPLDFFFSEEIFIKLSSILFSTPTGWIYIAIYILMLVFIVQIYFDAAVLYMTAIIMVGLLISIAPIFIVFYLFSQTKSFFDNWLKQITAYSVQMILVYAGILFMTLIIRNQIYNTLGFPVCAKEFPSVGNITIFKWYFPKIASTSKAPKLAVIPIPKDHFETIADQAVQNMGGHAAIKDGFTVQNLFDSEYCKANPSKAECQPTTSTNKFCSAYECTGLRYPDLPFLDPNDSYERKLINQIRNGYIGDFSGLAIIAVCIYLMDHFNKSTVSMAQFLSSTTGNAGSNAAAASAASAGLGSMMKAQVSYAAEKSGLTGMVKRAQDKVHDVFAQAKYDLIDKGFADRKIASLRAEALNGKNSLLRTEAESLSKTSHAKATAFSRNIQNSNYAQRLESQLNSPNINRQLVSGNIVDRLNNSTTQDFKAKAAEELFGRQVDLTKFTESEQAQITQKINERAEQLSKKQITENFKEIASQEIFGKDSKYATLNASDVRTIDKLAADMRAMLDDKAVQDEYVNNYVKAYMSMTEKGMGLLRRNSSLARDIYNVKKMGEERLASWDKASLGRAQAISNVTKGWKESLLPDAFKEVDYAKRYEDADTKVIKDKLSALMTERSGPGGQGASSATPFDNKEYEIREKLDAGESSESILGDLAAQRKEQSSGAVAQDLTNIQIDELKIKGIDDMLGESDTEELVHDPKDQYKAIPKDEPDRPESHTPSRSGSTSIEGVDDSASDTDSDIDDDKGSARAPKKEDEAPETPTEDPDQNQKSNRVGTKYLK